MKRASTRRRGWVAFATIALLMSFLSARAVQTVQSQRGPASGPQTRGSRSAGVQPKRTTHRGAATPDLKAGGKAGPLRSLAAPALNSLSPALATADFDLIGLAATAGPATQTVPKNTPTAVLASVQVPEGGDPSAIIAGLSPNYRVRGELTGPSLSSPLVVEARLGEPLNIPPLARAGDHVLQNLRVVDIGLPDEPVVAPVAPDSCGIVVIDRLLISEVHVNELSYEQIVQAGINITDDSYRAFNFTLGIGTTSDAQQISIPVAFPSVGATDPRPVVGIPNLGVGTSVPIPDVVPIMLEIPDGDGGGPGLELEGEGPVRIPGVVVFPGRVGFLHQFFEAIVIVANGAPGGTPLVVRNLHAKVRLPDNGTPDPSDDPLRIADTQTGGRVSDLEIHGLGQDGHYGTGDDTASFSPGQSGQATFLLEGLKEGLHTVNFDLEGTLEGLPRGPVTVRGEVPGAVLVRDASFAATFTHPSVVRAGQEYDLAMTMYNSGQRDIQGAFAQLSRNSISGASFAATGDDGRRAFQTTIKRGQSATVKWHLRSNTTGAVTASYVKVGDDVSAGLSLVTGVGDRGVPLSPDSLILPDSVAKLPADVIEAARGVLGQAWSVANAPAGSLPQGVTPISKQAVIDRAVELGVAGMRVDFGEPVPVSLETLVRDWLGELKPDDGFADALRNTPAGYVFYDTVGSYFARRLASNDAPPMSPSDLQHELANTESPRSPFISALVTQAAGQGLFGARLVNSQGGRVGFGDNSGERAGEIARGASMTLARTDAGGNVVDSSGQLILVSTPGGDDWKLELSGWQAGTVDISLLVPGSGHSYRHVVFGGVQVTPGGKYRVTVRPGATATPVLEEFRDGGYQPTGVPATSEVLGEPAPRLVGAIQVTPDVVNGGDRYGRLLGLLFSKPMAEQQAETAENYKIGGGALKGTTTPQQVGGVVGIRSARLDLGSRFVFISLDAPVGPYINRDISVNNLRDARGAALAPVASQTIEPRVSPQGVPPGAYLTGRVMSADGTPVTGAQVVYWTQPCDDGKSLFSGQQPEPVAIRQTGADGLYAFDYVRNGDCGPLFVTVTNPVTRSEKKLTTPVVYDGQHMTLDLVFLARGRVQGTVTSGARTVPNAFVKIVPELDVVGSKVVQADTQGNYVAEDIPVGNVSVSAVGTGTFANATGLSAGTITGPGRTAFVNISMQNVSGAVRGRVVNPDGSPVPGALVVVYAAVAGFPNPARADGMIAVGYVYAARDGGFAVENLPVGDIRIEVTDYVTGLNVGQSVQLSNERPELEGILIAIPGYGTVTGTVTDDTGTFVPDVIVSSGSTSVRADALGQYTLPNLRPGTQTITALDPVSRMTGSTVVPVRLGETTSGANITITRPATITGHVTRLEGAVQTPVSGVFVTNDGFNFTTTDAQGRYTLRNLPSNTEFTLRVVDTNTKLASNLPVVLGPGATVTRDVTFRTASLHGRVTQPDGVTGTVAQVDVYAPLPSLASGSEFGLIRADRPISVNSGADGNYQLTGLNPGQYRATVSNGFFPTRVSKGGTLVVGEDAECNLTLVNRLAGKIQGRVFQPDGTTLVGAGVEVTLGGGALADVTVRTDEQGHYEFAEVFSEGGYQLTATDPATGLRNRSYISVRFNQDAGADIRLLGLGALRVHVIDGGGNPVTGGQVNLDGSDYPNARRFSNITPDAAGVILYDGLPEGNYAVAASQNGLGGRASAAVTPGSIVEVTVKLQAVGSVEGKVFMPGGATPVGLADVQLFAGGRAIGFTTTDDSDAARGSFGFVGVPAGDFTLDVLDNRTGRVGRGFGRVTQQGEVATVNVELLPLGRVAGRVTANGQPVDHALVEISADGSGLRYTRLQATTDADGRYSFTGIPVGRFNVRITNAPGGQTGAASGSVSGNTEPLPDTIVDIALEPSATVTGTIYRAGGTEPLPGAHVTLLVGSRRLETATNASGVYRLGFVPLGELRVRAEAPSGFDRGESQPFNLTEPASTANVNVTLAGVGSASGDVLDSNGVRLTTGSITLTNDAWGAPLVLVAPVQPNGRYEITGAPAGNFTLKLTVPNRIGVGTSSGVIAAGQNLDLAVRIEDAGAATGTVVAPDGTTPVRGADITLTLARQGKPGLRFFTNTNAQGIWSVENLPLGSVSVAVSDVVSGGVARTLNVPLNTNGQRVDVGRMVLDNTPIRVESVTPPDGAASISPSARTITVTFSEPADPSTVHGGSVRLLRGANGVGANVTLSGDGRTATLTAAARLADTTAYTVLVSGVTDPTGHALTNDFRSTFNTSDEIGPSVIGVTPAVNALEVALDSAVVVTFNEPLDRAQDLSGLVRLLSGATPGTPVAGSVTLDESGKVATFRAADGLVLSRRYAVSVTGVRDLVGNVQPDAFSSGFITVNPAPSVALDEPAEGAQWTEGQNVRLAATASDNTAVARVLFKVNGNVVGAAGAAPYSITYTVPVGQVGPASVEAVAEDELGKTTSAMRAVVVVADPPPTVTLTAPAEGTQLIEGQTIELAATASDDGSISRVVFAANGATLGADSSEPYTQSYTVPSGVASVSLSAQAFDNLGKNSTATRSCAVVPDPGTTVRGRVVNNSGQPVPNASISVFDTYTATTGADGRFSIANVPTVRGDITARATATINARVVSTVSERKAPSARATTDLGDITLAVMQFESDLGTLADFGGGNDDNYVVVPLPFTFKFYGRDYTQAFLGTNGYVTFGSGDTNYSESADAFNGPLPRVAALFDDWLPQQVPTNGVYINTQLPGRAVFTWRVVPQFGSGLPATFQAILFANGRVQLGYNAVQTRGGLVGITPGSAPTAQAVDFSAQSFAVDGSTAPYELFDGGQHSFDLERTYIGFSPTAVGGYDVQVQPPSVNGDDVGPVVNTVSPSNGAEQVATDAVVNVTFNEPLDRTQDPRNVLKVYAASQASTPLAGDVTLDAAGQSLTFRPTGGLAESTRYTATVTGQMDAIGNIQFGIVNSTFMTVDHTPPQISSFRIADLPAVDGLVVNSTRRPQFAVAYQDASDIDVAATRLLLGPAGSAPVQVAASVAANGLTYQPDADFSTGGYVAQVVVTDRWGNTTTTELIHFQVNPDAPSITGISPAEGSRFGETAIVIRGLHLGNVTPPPAEPRPGLRGDYFGDSVFSGESAYFTTLLFSREDATVNFEWGSGGPAPDAPTDLFMVRWTGQVEPRFSESYNFHAVTDDGVRLWVDGQLVIDQWVPQPPTETTGTIMLEAGRKYDIRLEYFEQFGGATAKLLWSSASQPKEVIPADRLSHSALPLPQIFIGGNPATVTGGAFGATDILLATTPAGALGPADVEVRTDHGSAFLRGGFNYLATPPRIVNVVPAANATRVSTATNVVVTFDQPLDPTQDLSAVLKVLQFSCFDFCNFNPLAGTVTLDPTGRVLTFTPAAHLPDSQSFLVEVNNARSLEGDMYSDPWSGFFTTVDTTAPVVGPWTYNDANVDGTTVPFSRMQLFVSIQETGSGTDGSSLVITLDGQRVTEGVSFFGNAFYFMPSEPLANGTHTVTARIADNSGNVSQISSATFTVSDVVQVASVSPSSGSQRGGTVIQLRGIGLISSDGGQPTVLVGGNPATFDLDAGDCVYWRTSGACLAARVPEGVPGAADIVVQTDHGTATITGGFTYLAEEQTRFEVEADTALLWHFEWNDSYWDADNNFPVPGYYTTDFGPYSLDASDNWNSPSGFVTQGYPSRGIIGEGRFGDGVKDPALTADEDYGVLGFGDRGFTVEGWVKVDTSRPLARTYTLFGKEDAKGQNTDYALSLLPSGALRAQVFNAQGVVWEAATEATAGAADGRWHSLAMVVERGAAPAENRLVLYVDGVERAAAQVPAGFGAVRDGGERFRAGHSDADAPDYEKAAFPGWMDELRVSSTAHTADRIQRTYHGATLGLVALRATPANVERGGGDREIEVAGYNLRGVTASVTATDGSPLPVTVSVSDSTDTRAHLIVNADASAPLGEARLNLSADTRTATLPLYVTAQHAFEVEPGTVLLWHMDEPAYYEVADSGPNAINGHAVNFNWPNAGLFGYARGRRVSLEADADNPALAFGNSGFTVQTWVSANMRYEMGTFTLVGKEDAQGQNADFELSMLPTGELRAQVYDTQGHVWEVKGPPVADWNWHLVSMVVERGAAPAENRLVLYVDGVERAAAQVPAGFGAMRNTGNLIRAGNHDADGPEDTSEWTPSDAFFGYLDDIHILNYAQTAAHIRNYWLGRPLAELDQAARRGAKPFASSTPAQSSVFPSRTAATQTPTPASAPQAPSSTSSAPRPPRIGRPPEPASGREGGGAAAAAARAAGGRR